MLLQIKKKGVSVMIGYVLLVSFVIILGIIVYQWMKTYVPQDEINCPEGVSIFIQDYDCNPNELTLELKNNGKFNIGGYFIYATNDPEQELAIIDLSQNNTDVDSRLSPIGVRLGEIGEDSNSLIPNEVETETFNLSSFSGILYSVEIVPIRWQIEKNRNRLVSCKDAKIKETINCVECTDTCSSLGYECGIQTVCTKNIDCGEGQSCEDLHGAGYVCNANGQCVYSADCGNSIIDDGEDCDDGDTSSGDGCSSGCLIETGWSCSGEPSVCIKIRMDIIYIGFENSGEIDNWEEDPSQSDGDDDTLAISGTDECSPKVGSYMLSGTGNFDPSLVRYERTAIDVTGYGNILIKYSMASEDTESSDRIEFYYYSGSSWEQCNETVNRNGNTCTGWDDFECPVSLDSGVTDLVLGVAWETSATNEHAFWDDINITGMVI